MGKIQRFRNACAVPGGRDGPESAKGEQDHIFHAAGAVGTVRAVEGENLQDRSEQTVLLPRDDVPEQR